VTNAATAIGRQEERRKRVIIDSVFRGGSVHRHAGTRHNDERRSGFHPDRATLIFPRGWASALSPVASLSVGSLIKKRRKRMRKKKHKKMLRRTRHQRRK
jgi:hypothetical protein